MDPIYDRDGRVCAWIDDDRVREVSSGQVEAFVKGENLFSLSGTHLAHFRNGHFRDRGGAAVAWISGAQGGPIKPVRQVTPVRPVRGIAPIRPIMSIPPIPAIPSLSWSPLSWRQLIQGA